MKCQECNKEIKNFKALATHIQFKHKKKQYYDNYLKQDGEGICKTCSADTEFTILNRGYNIFCSKICEKKDYSSRMINNNPMKKESAKLNQRNTNLSRYGVRQNTQRPEIKEQIKQTNLKKYGVENIAQDLVIKKKSRASRIKFNLKKFNTTENFMTNESLEKMYKTNLDRHGVKVIFQSKEMQKKIKKTNLERYGVEYIMQNKKIFEKAQKKMGGAHHYRDLYYRGSYELDFLETYYNKFKIEQGKSFKYNFEYKDRIYHSDFFIAELNLVIEIKNSYAAKRFKNIIDAKKQAALKEGYNFIMITDKIYNDFKLVSAVK